MLSKIKLATAALLLGALTACGGGDGDDFNSSFSKTITKNGVTYVCKSQSAANACENNNDCTACETSTTGAVITAQCATSMDTTTVTQNGCIATLGGKQQTGVCISGGTSTALRLLTGTGYSKQKVLAEGALFTSGGDLIINGTTIKCA